MSSDDLKNEPLLNHEYDGIRELDYPLPAWWLATFFVTIIFSSLYWLHYEVSEAGPSLSEELKVAMDEIRGLQQKAEQTAPSVTEEALAAFIQDTAAIEAGKAEYIAKCAACHGLEGGGMIGPNLTDNHWKNSDGTLVGIHKTLVVGVPEKGMPAWKGLISDETIKHVTAYVATLKGTNPPNAKAPEGTLVE
jgi:cytochrome c oxidase cbb3-type subunit 3